VSHADHQIIAFTLATGRYDCGSTRSGKNSVDYLGELELPGAAAKYHTFANVLNDLILQQSAEENGTDGLAAEAAFGW